MGKVIRFLALLLACLLSTLALPTPAFGILIAETANTAYDATVVYDGSQSSSSAYEDAARPPTGDEKHASGATRTLLSRNADFLAAESGATRLGNLQTTFENLADQHLLPQFRAIDPGLEAGYTGSFRTGIVGNPNKATFGQPINLSNFDIDYWIKSDVLYNQYGNSLKANVGFRNILSETPGFEGLKPNKAGFSIKFLPSSP